MPCGLVTLKIHLSQVRSNWFRYVILYLICNKYLMKWYGDCSPFSSAGWCCRNCTSHAGVFFLAGFLVQFVCAILNLNLFRGNMRMTSDIRSLSDPAEIMQAGWKTVVLKVIKPNNNKPLLIAFIFPDFQKASYAWLRLSVRYSLFSKEQQAAVSPSQLGTTLCTLTELTAWKQHWVVLTALPGGQKEQGSLFVPRHTPRRKQVFSFIS